MQIQVIGYARRRASEADDWSKMQARAALLFLLRWGAVVAVGLVYGWMFGVTA